MEITEGATTLSPSGWLGALPFLVLAAVVFATKRGLLTAALAFLFVSTGLTLLVWQVFPAVMLGSLLKGLFVSFDILLIIAGALFLLDVLKKTRVLSSLEHYLHQLAPDSRIQAIILAWFLGALIEGSAGFGAPAAVIAPLLVHMGFAPVTAAATALLANTAPVAFGAAGTPVRVGLGFADTATLLPWLAGFGALLALIVPVLLAKLLKREVSSRTGIIGPHGFSHATGEPGESKPSSIMPFAVWAGVSFALPFYLASRLGPEFPTVYGASAAILLTVGAAQLPWWRKVFLPRITQRLKAHDPNLSPLHVWRVILPYVAMVLGLMIGRAYLPSVTIALPGTLSHAFNFFNPGLIFLILGIGFAWHGRLGHQEVRHSVTQLGNRVLRTAAIITAVVAATQLMINSDQNLVGNPGMLAGLQDLITRENVLMTSPFIGALGAFMAGSTTVSNLIFAQVQWDTALLIGTSGFLVLTLQVFGATAGNVIALTNISAVESTLNTRNLLRPVLLKLSRYLLLYTVVLVAAAAVVSTALS